MNNNEFGIPFERAFKRLRVDGDDLSDSSKDTSLNSDRTSNSDTTPRTSFSVELWNDVTQERTQTSFNNSTISNIVHHSADPLNVRTVTHRNTLSKFQKVSQSNSLLNDAKMNVKPTNSSTELTQNCSHQARHESDITVDELAGYLDVQLYLPKKMSFMAELAYS